MSLPVFLPAPRVLWGSIPPNMMTDSRSGRNNDVSDMYSFCDPSILMLITFLETVGSYCGYVMCDLDTNERVRISILTWSFEPICF